jgi:hypothetical protein
MKREKVCMKNFSDVPEDPDTTILAQAEVEIGDLPALYQSWSWEGILAESVIFHSGDVAGVSDEALLQMVQDSYTILEDKFTIKRGSEGYVFVNFNFRLHEDLLDSESAGDLKQS